LFFLLAAVLLFSQEILSPAEDTAESEEPSVFTEDAVEDAVQPPSYDDSTLFVIVDYKFNVKGISRPFALQYKLIEKGEFRQGETITGTANLEKYISLITQIFINQRVLKDNVEVSYSAGDQNPDGSYPVTIMIKVEDTWNIIALPRPYYKNNDFDLTIKARDYNFLGTMNALRVDLGYGYDGDAEQPHSFLFGVYFDTPFKFWNHYWNFTFDNTVQFRLEAPVYYENTTGLSMDMPFRSTTFTFGVTERIYANQENSDWAKANGYGTYHNGMYMSGNPYVNWRIPTGLMMYRFGELTYTPSISATFNHSFPEWPISDDRRGPFIGLSHSLGFGNIDWHGNYREGLAFSMGNSYSYDFNRDIHSVSFDLTGIVHHVFTSFFAVSARFMYRYGYSSDNGGEFYVSNFLRGVEDSSISAYEMLSVNLDLPVRLFAFTPSIWFNDSKLRLFDLEVHAAPVIDLALYRHKFFDYIMKYGPEEYAVTGGLEVVVFSLFMRSLYVRLGFTINAKQFLKDLIKERSFRIPGGNDREIYLIMGHFY
jgi:hypothetical protein